MTALDGVEKEALHPSAKVREIRSALFESQTQEEVPAILTLPVRISPLCWIVLYYHNNHHPFPIQ
jgi:hypothetical protein